MDGTRWHIVKGTGPLVAAAVHDGHDTRDEVADLLALDSESRLREEDPYTKEWATIAPTNIVVSRSRFEVDLNRPRKRAVYIAPADAWGLDIWRSPPPKALIDRSLAQYDQFMPKRERCWRQ